MRKWEIKQNRLHRFKVTCQEGKRTMTYGPMNGGIHATLINIAEHFEPGDLVVVPACKLAWGAPDNLVRLPELYVVLPRRLAGGHQN